MRLLEAWVNFVQTVGFVQLAFIGFHELPERQYS